VPAHGDEQIEYGDVSSRLRELRLYKNLGRRQLAELVNVPFEAVDAWESGDAQLTYDQVTALALALGVSSA
jgi:transcriptional regulator with XRE-family HTH domain